MRVRLYAASAMLGAAVLTLLVPPLRAETQVAPVRTFRLEYEAPAACGGGEGFIQEVGTRSSRIAFASDGLLVQLTISEAETASGFSGRMTVGGAVDSTRELTSERCPDLVSGLALALVLAVDPGSLTRPPETNEDADPEPPVTDTPPAAPPSKEKIKGRAVVPWLAGVLGTAGTTPVPAPVLGVGLFVERGGWFAVRAAATAEFGSEQATPDYSVRFQTFGAALAGCPMRSASPAFEVGGCATINLGATRALTKLPTLPEEQVSVRPRFDVALGPAFAARVASIRALMLLELTVPIVRDDFVIEGGAADARVHRSDPVGVRATVAVSVPFANAPAARLR